MTILDRKASFPSSVLVRIIRYGLFFSVFIPLIIFRNFWSPTNFGKVIVFRILVEIILALWIILITSDKQYRPHLNLVGLGLMVFMISYGLSSFFGANPLQSFWGGFERMGGLFNLIHYFIFFIIAVSVLKSLDDCKDLMRLSILTGVAVMIYGFLQLGHWSFILGTTNGSVSRIYSTIGNPAMFAGYMLFVFYFSLIFCIGEWANQNKPLARYGYGLIAVLAFVAILLSAVRGAVLALGISLLGFIIFYVFYLTKHHRLGNRTLKIFLIFLCSITLSVFLISRTHFFYRIIHFSYSETTVHQRILVWQEAVTGFKQKPLLGWGPENFNIVHEKYFNPQIYNGPGGSIFDRAHNVFFEVLTTQGLLGILSLIFFIGVVVVGIRNLIKKSTMTGVLFGALLVAYFIQDLFFFDTFTTYLMLTITLVVLALQTKETKLNQIPTLAPITLDTKKIALIIVLLVSMGYGIYIYSVLPAIANNLSARAAVALSNGQYSAGTAEWKQALGSHIPSPFISEIYGNVTPVYVEAVYKQLNFLDGKKVQQDLNDLIVLSPIMSNRRILLVDPYMITDNLNVTRANFFDHSQISYSIEWLKTATQLAPNMIWVWQELGNVELINQDYPAAVISLKNAYDLNKNYLPSQFMLGKAYLLNNQISSGIDLVVGAFSRGYNNQNDFIWFATYLKGKDKTEFIGFLSLMASKNPNYLIFLAIGYKDTGKIKEARQTADLLLNYEDTHPGILLNKNNYNTLAELYGYFKDVKSRTRAFEKAGTLTPF